MEGDYCTDCRAYTNSVYDHSSGDTICTECGLVLDSHYINDTAEWRTFTDDINGGNDPIRVGKPTNPFLDGGNLGTLIEKSPLHIGIKKWQPNNKKYDYLLSSFSNIDMLTENLGLVQIIKDSAKELYKKAYDAKIFGSTLKNDKGITVACLYLACQQEGLPRTLKEVLSAARGTKVKDVHKAMSILKRHLEVGGKNIQAKDIARRFCSNLGLDSLTTKVVQETVCRSEECDMRRNPISILAAIIYMINQLSEDNNIQLKDILKVTGIGEATMKKAYKDLYPYATVLIPTWYASTDVVMKRCHL